MINLRSGLAVCPSVDPSHTIPLNPKIQSKLVVESLQNVIATHVRNWIKLNMTEAEVDESYDLLRETTERLLFENGIGQVTVREMLSRQKLSE